jgi:hypothetical protein
MHIHIRLAIIVAIVATTVTGSLAPAVLEAAADPSIFIPYAASMNARDVAAAFTSDQSGVLATGGGHILAVGPRSVPTYQDGSPATISLSVDVGATPAQAPPNWLRIVSPPATFGPENFTFTFPLTVRMPVAGVKDVTNLYFLRHNADSGWTRSLFAFDPNNPATAVETTLFTLGAMAVGEYDGASAAAMHPPGGLYVPSTHCPSGAMECFYYLTIQSFTPKFADEVPAGTFNGQVLRLRSNVTGESPEPTGWLLPQGTYTFCYSALESPLTLSNLRKFINPNPQTVTIDRPYACGVTFTCKTEVRPQNQPGWMEARDDRPCGMGGGGTGDDPATLGRTGDFQATLTWSNSSSRSTDVDLHLLGPGGLHIFYNAKLSADGSLRLDRDWQYEYGHAVENIYQQKDSAGKSIPMPPGSYTLRVDHYGGDSGMPYQVRVIRNGAVSNFGGTLAAGEQRVLMTFNVP